MDQQEWMNEIAGRVLSKYMDDFGKMPTEQELQLLIENDTGHCVAAWEVE